MWPRSAGILRREGRRGRAHQACACARSRSGRAEREGAGGAEVSLFQRSGRCVAERVATTEVGRDRVAEPLGLFPSVP